MFWSLRNIETRDYYLYNLNDSMAKQYINEKINTHKLNIQKNFNTKSDNNKLIFAKFKFNKIKQIHNLFVIKQINKSC